MALTDKQRKAMFAKKKLSKSDLEGSTKFSGVGLFDIANKVGQWEGQLGRGLQDAWVHKKTGDTVIVEPFEDKEGEDEVWVHDEEGNHDTITIDKPEQALKEAKMFMLENPKGWK